MVIAQGYETVGEVVMLKEVLEGGDRALVISHADEERVARLAEPLRQATLRAGDSLLLEPRSGYVYERIPKAEVEELILEEVPDITYADIGGLGGADRADPGRHRAALPARGPVPASTSSGRPRACCCTARPAAARRSSPRRWRTRWPRRSRRRTAQDEGTERGQELLPEHQGPRAAQQVRRRDRAAHPAGVPAGQGEGQRGHAGHRVLRRDGLDLPYPRLRRVQRRGEHDRARSCSARSTGSRAWRT